MPQRNGSDSPPPEPSDQLRSSPADRPDLRQVFGARLSRRGLLAAGVGLGAGAVLTACGRNGAVSGQVGPYGFVEVPWGVDGHMHIPEGYRADVLLRWGDPLGAGAPAFDPHRMTAAAQEQQFGYNCDYTTFLPLGSGRDSSTHGLLIVNHEFSLPPLMHPNAPAPTELSADQLLADMAAHGLSIVEVARGREGWRYLPDSRYNRRITPHTPMLLDGPAAGHRRLRLNNRDGIHTRGTWNNCAGGVTPWGTVLTAEEDIQFYFQGNPAGGPEAENHQRYGISGDATFGWYQAEQRWQLDRDPAYPLYGGWMVELDPRDPNAVPVKHTALGRMRHEGCAITVNGDGRLVCYMADDQAFEYIYRYVSRGQLSSRADERDRLLREGELSVARFQPDGNLEWLPLVYGQGPLTPDNGFEDQADVLLNTRRAADLAGATPMDRPEGIAVHPLTGRLYCSLTGNPDRREPDAANPRVENLFGHIIEFIPPSGDHAAPIFRWNLFLKAGRNGEESRLQHPDSGEGSYFINPDNLVFDPAGTLWIGTDGASAFGLADALMAVEVDGARRGLASRFLTAPVGAEVTGPSFTPDGSTLFCSIQHPGAVVGSTFERPATRWPDFSLDIPPRPSVVAVTRLSGGRLID